MFNKKLKDRITFLEKQLQVSADNELYRGLYQYLPKGLKLSRDEKMDDYIHDGYESNPDVFSISNKIASLFARIDIKAYKGETEIDNPLIKYFDDNAADYTYYEFNYNWEMFGIITGNAIVYNDFRKLGNNEGSVKAFDIMPTQNVEISSAGFRQPIGSYTLDIDNKINIDPKKVWHTRMFPNLDYKDGRNFMGISPVKVAAMIILAQNAGYDIIEDMLRNGIPPGILTKIGEYEKTAAQQQEAGMRKKWRRAGRNKLPVFTLGDLRYIKIGFDNLRDLQVIESNKSGRQILCNIWGLPVQLFNDTSASTYNNMMEADKAIYKNRIMPDIDRYCAGLNKLFRDQGITFSGDFSGIEALQDNRKELAAALKILVDAKLLGRDEARNILRDALNIELEELNIEGLTLEDMINEPQINSFNINPDGY